VFDSTPPSSAAEGALYSYVLHAADPQGSPVSYTLETAPTGASLSNGTLQWTPSPQQSRAPNQFIVIASTAQCLRATQSWSVAPTGTVTVTDNITYLASQPAITVPIDTSSNTMSLPVSDSSGGLQTFSAIGSANGVTRFMQIPTGHFWLVPVNVSLEAALWTAARQLGQAFFDAR
jgi:hypothetical protein